MKSMGEAVGDVAWRDWALVSRVAVAEIATTAPRSRDVGRVIHVVYDSTSAGGVVKLALELGLTFGANT